MGFNDSMQVCNFIVSAKVGIIFNCSNVSKTLILFPRIINLLSVIDEILLTFLFN